MKIKRLLLIIFAFILTFSLIACGGDDGGTSSGDVETTPTETTPPPTGTPEPTKEPEDPCPCCPDCKQEECECVECGNNDDCECKLPFDIGTFTIIAEGTDKHIENEYAKFDYTLTLSATNEGDSLFGDYIGTGWMQMVHDEADYLLAMDGQMISSKLVVDGQLSNIRFTLERPQPGDDQNIVAKGSGKMQWNNTVLESVAVTADGDSVEWPWAGNSTEHFTIEILLYDSGTGVLNIGFYFSSLNYEVRLERQ